MLNTFRKLRQKLTSPNTSIKYIKYAIGEIILIVLGILIALALNNANQKAKERKAEKILLSSIHSEFKQNTRILADRSLGIIETDGATRSLINLMNTDLKKHETLYIDSLIFKTIDYAKFIPAQITMTELVQTGKIGLVSQTELKEALLSWAVKLENSNTTHSLFAKWIEETILPYLTKNIALKNIDLFSDIGFQKGSSFDNGYEKIFKEREFENILDNHLYHLSLMMIEYEELEVIIEKIIELSSE